MRLLLKFNLVLAANIFLLLGCASEPSKNSDMAAAERIVAAVKRQQATTNSVDFPSHDKTRQTSISKSDPALSAPKPKDTTHAWTKNLIFTFDKIESDYFEPVSKKKLLDACISALPEQTRPLKSVASSFKQQLNDIGELLNNFPKIEAQTAVDSCVTAAISSLGNKYDQYIDPKKFNELNTSIVSNSGVGIELAPDPDGARFVSVIECAPGEALGLLKEDVITHIDAIEVSGRSVEEITKMIQVGLDPTLTIIAKRKGMSSPLTLATKRADILRKSVHGCLLDSDVAYIEIRQFQKPTLEQLGQIAASFSRASNSRPLKAIILDLRLNGGGLLQTSVGTAAAFLQPNALIVEIRGRTEDSNKKLYNARKVLVGPRTAVGAEIVASALQDHKRATVLGMNTFGKSTVETIIPLTWEAALKLTTSRIYRSQNEPLGKITPDIAVDMQYLFGDGDKTDVKLPRDKIGISNDPAVARALIFLSNK
jgi:C-terminal peptidase prc